MCIIQLSSVYSSQQFTCQIKNKGQFRPITYPFQLILRAKNACQV